MEIAKNRLTETLVKQIQEANEKGIIATAS